VKLYDGGKTAPIPVPYESMVPKAIKDVFHAWASEVMNQGVHVHSKVIVIDPFGKKPVVITGSHNLGYKASTKNDDNMMIVEGNAPLAASYAANIIAIYQTYRWNTYVDAHAKDPQVWHGLVDNATWQDSYLKADGGDLAEIKFWLGEGASAAASGAPVVAPASGGAEVRAATASGPSPHVGKGARRRPAAAKKPAKKATSTKSASAKRAPAKSRRAPAKKAAGKTARPKAAAARSKRARARTAPSKKAMPTKRPPTKSSRASAKKAPAKTRRASAKSRRAPAKKAPAKTTRRVAAKTSSSARRRGK
jgi:hypothetical protein